jgi:hypothetical protein
LTLTTRDVSAPHYIHTWLPPYDLLAERNTHHLHLAMMKLLTLALLFGVGAATSLRVGNDVCKVELEKAKAATHLHKGSFAGETCRKDTECYSGKCEGNVHGLKDGACTQIDAHKMWVIDKAKTLVRHRSIRLTGRAWQWPPGVVFGRKYAGW